MAITIGTPDVQCVQGPKLKTIIVDITMDNSYPTGGETCDLSSYFGTACWGGHPIDDMANAGYLMRYDPAASNAPATGKLLAYYFDYDAGADGAGIQVANTTDLSALTGKWIFWGY
jgi:hypothetical protein